MIHSRETDQTKTPLFDALRNYIDTGVIPFHVPGHKRGAGLHEFAEYAGRKILEMDVNGMEDLDNICNPIGVIKKSEDLLAKLYKADHSFFLVNGTTHGVQSMILHSCKPNEEIILPRNAHKSTIGALILSGAVPVYVQPEINRQLGIAMGMDTEKVRKTIRRHPCAKAIFVIHPTYYGAISDLKKIIHLAHKQDMLVLADEAHGSHLPFHPDLPASAMELGADMSSISLHKTGGSMTQSSALLLQGKRIDPAAVKTALNLTQTTSASYVLMASLDLARKQLALKGYELMDQVLDLVRYARQQINQIEGLYAFGAELAGSPGVYAFDETKLGIHVRGLGMSGHEMEFLLRKKYNIQVEMSDFYNILAIISLGDNRVQIDKLIHALKEIAKTQGVHPLKEDVLVPPQPPLIVSPREAFYSMKKAMTLENCVGEISGEMVMAYPPGIPVVCPGERINRDVVDYIKMLKTSRYQLQGTEDPYADTIKVLGT